MKIGNFDLNKDILIVAEIGNNHEGSFALAKKMIHLAKEAGAGAVKFQAIVPDRLVSIRQKQRIRQLEKFRLSNKEFEQLSRVARREGLLFLSTPFDAVTVHSLAPLVAAFKIASGDNDFFPLINVIARTGKPIILSTGLADIKQILKTVDFIQNIWRQSEIKQEIALLHCVTSYPVRPEEANLLAIRTLGRQFNATVGYSDHTLGIDACVLAAALGARIIEKHFTIDNNYSDFHDHKISADHKDFALLVRRVREAEKMLGDGVKRLQDSEKTLLKAVRRSIVAKRKLSKGTVLNLNDLDWVRADKGLVWGQEGKILGKTLVRPVQRGESIALGDVY